MSRKKAKAVVNVTEYLGAGTVNSMFEKFKSVLSNFINRTIKRNGIKANIQANEIIKDGNSLIIDFSVSEIDYFSIAKKAIPLIFDEYLKDSSGVFVQIVNIIGYENEEFIFAVLNAISDEKKEQIIGVLIDNYQETICEKMTDILAKQNIDIEINKVSML